MTITDDNTPVPASAPRLVLGRSSDFARAMHALSEVANAGLDPVVKELVQIRISQLNGCAFCIDMHTRDARALDIGDQRLFGLTAWRETPYYTARERAALALGEAITRLGEHGIPDEVFDEAARVFDEPELRALIHSCIVINSWNRLTAAYRTAPALRDEQ